MRRILFILAAVLTLAACEPVPPYGPPPPGPYPPPPSYPPPPGTPPGPGDTGGICSGIAGFVCRSPGDYCRMPTGQCRMPDAAGVCTPKPQVCAEIYQPVCGCDGRTYGNACEAETAGVNPLHAGACR